MKVTIRKWEGDDLYSWAVFRSDRITPIYTGCSKREAEYFKRIVEKEMKEMKEKEKYSEEKYEVHSELVNTNLTMEEKIEYIKARYLIAGIRRCDVGDWEQNEMAKLLLEAEETIKRLNKKI